MSTEEQRRKHAEYQREWRRRNSEKVAAIERRYRVKHGLAAEPRKKRPPGLWHGTTGGYSNHKCRCDACKAAWKESCRVTRLRRIAKSIPDDKHGTYNGYTNYKCRCDLCYEAARHHAGSTTRHPNARVERVRIRRESPKLRPVHTRFGWRRSYVLKHLTADIHDSLGRTTFPALDRYFERMGV